LRPTGDRAPLQPLDQIAAAADNLGMNSIITTDETPDARLYAPAAARNRNAICAVLMQHLPGRGTILEIASGSGEHIIHLAAASGDDVMFQPSDPDPAARASIDAWTKATALANVHPAIAIDATAGAWSITSADAVIAINMIHIAPWAAAIGLFANAAAILPADGLLYLYGPFHRNGAATSPSNAAFDASLQQSNPAWGVRDLEAVADLGDANGFAAPEIVAMPTNNLSLIFKRRPI
jgi:Protein of unknown function (DUF938)